MFLFFVLAGEASFLPVRRIEIYQLGWLVLLNGPVCRCRRCHGWRPTSAVTCGVRTQHATGAACRPTRTAAADHRHPPRHLAQHYPVDPAPSKYPGAVRWASLHGQAARCSSTPSLSPRFGSPLQLQLTLVCVVFSAAVFLLLRSQIDLVESCN